jgi:hypothetical protein
VVKRRINALSTSAWERRAVSPPLASEAAALSIVASSSGLPVPRETLRKWMMAEDLWANLGRAPSRLPYEATLPGGA